jgi:hypothetical protein
MYRVRYGAEAGQTWPHSSLAAQPVQEGPRCWKRGLVGAPAWWSSKKWARRSMNGQTKGPLPVVRGRMGGTHGRLTKLVLSKTGQKILQRPPRGARKRPGLLQWRKRRRVIKDSKGARNHHWEWPRAKRRVSTKMRWASTLASCQLWS